MTFWTGAPVHRHLVRETDGPEFTGGAHRPLRIPGEKDVVKIAVSDRPRLSNLVPRLLAGVGAQSAIAALPEGAYWLHNKGLADYLRRVPDSERITRLLRRVGLTDRFQGGFLIGKHEFESVAPTLASQPFCGGPDVYFAAVPGPVLITACHEFDLHLETPSDELFAQLQDLTRGEGLEARGLDEELSSLAIDD